MPDDTIPVQWTLRGAVVRLPGEIDAVNCEQVRIALNETLRAVPAVLVADMTCTTFCASDGLRVLMQAHRAAQRAESALRIAGMNPRIGRIVTLIGAGEILDVYPSTEAAFAGRHSPVDTEMSKLAAGALTTGMHLRRGRRREDSHGRPPA